ncbi:hypothetical protein ABEB36_004299 [Hypothenemus hampei]|uniref:Secreted protein n=1 Tax=Hypothenemus hampei TaxID=57062 RepID=A0ABD1F3G7_HYPHA
MIVEVAPRFSSDHQGFVILLLRVFLKVLMARGTAGIDSCDICQCTKYDKTYKNTVYLVKDTENSHKTSIIVPRKK